MRRPLITRSQREQMLAYGVASASGADINPLPVVKLFTPDASCTWLLTELDPKDPDIAFGLCDLGMGFPELGSVRLSELISLGGSLGLRIERDLHFAPTMTLSAYADQARRNGEIVT